MSPSRQPPDSSEPHATVLTVNVGSSSIKFAFFLSENPPARLLSGQVEGIGRQGTVLRVCPPANQVVPKNSFSGEHEEVTRPLLDWFAAQAEFGRVAVVAHRLVHGGSKYREPQVITPELLDELCRISSLDPDHLPAEIEMIQAIRERFPGSRRSPVLTPLSPRKSLPLPA